MSRDPVDGSTTFLGRHYRSGTPVGLVCRAGVVLSVESIPESSVEPGVWLAPGIVDLQVNGFGGVDFQGMPTAGGLEVAIEAFRRSGGSRFLLTLISDDWSAMLDRVSGWRRLREQSGGLGGAVAGWHLEGPFLSAEAGFRGAHDAAVQRDPTPEDMDHLRERVGGDPVLITLAPEREGAVAAIRRAVDLGFRVSLGHTDAGSAAIRAALDAGACAFTHLGNGCPTLLHRHDNIIWRVADEPGLSCGLIPDGTHLPEQTFRGLHRLVNEDRRFYVTDAMSAAGAGPGCYRLGRHELQVGVDGVVRFPGSGQFAGSALTPVEGVRRAAEMLRMSWREVWDGFSVVPARLMGWRWGLDVGDRTEPCVVRVDAGGRIVRAVGGVDSGLT